jgi:poly-gamma-glutamate system protein
MKNLYWRPQKISRRVLLSIGILSIVGFALVEFCPMTRKGTDLDTKWEAASRSLDMMRAVKAERERRGIPIHTYFDTANSGIVGSAMSLTTSRPADLRSKQTSVNPNFAAVVVDLLQQAGVQRGDIVAVGWSGSFPAFNISVAAALEAMDVQPIVIASATSSQYGANDPDLMWVDMESMLRKEGHMSFGSAAISLGGGADRGLGMSPESIDAVRTAIDRNDVPMLDADRRAKSIQRRMDLYHELAKGQPIKAYINVGGGVASTGGQQGKHLFRPGLTRRASRNALQIDSVMTRFAREGRPIIHMIEAKRLAEQYAMPIAPAALPELGTGNAFLRTGANRWLAAAVLVTILVALRSYMITAWGYRIETWFASLRARQKAGLRVVSDAAPEPQLAEPQLMV